jgi:hypothetical protein
MRRTVCIELPLIEIFYRRMVQIIGAQSKMKYVHFIIGMLECYPCVHINVICNRCIDL